ncbi:MAG: hypothetical protein WAK01_08395, partial [Methylocystis sp.]
TAQCLAVRSPRIAQYTFDFTDDSAVTAFLKGGHAPGVAYVMPIKVAEMGPAIKAKGYKVQEGIGGYAAEWVQGSMRGQPNAKAPAVMYSLIDTLVKSGVTMIVVNEINAAPGEKSWFTPRSIAYNVRGINLIYDYIHKHYPGVEFGLTNGDGQGVGLHVALLEAGMKEDFAQIEYYYLALQPANPFVTGGLVQKFPNVKTAIFVYSTTSMCGNGGVNWLDPKQLDYISFWNLNNDGRFIGPWFDDDYLKNAKTFAATGKKSFCALPMSRVSSPVNWDTQTKSFTVTFQDNYMPQAFADPATFAASTLASCEYQVLSGANAIHGPSDPSVKVTQPWTPRTCNSQINITVGPTGLCRDKGANTCLVYARAHTKTGETGNTSYEEFSIKY